MGSKGTMCFIGGNGVVTLTEQDRILVLSNKILFNAEYCNLLVTIQNQAITSEIEMHSVVPFCRRNKIIVSQSVPCYKVHSTTEI